MSAKDIVLKPIQSKIANDFVKKHHYSWKVVNNSQLHFWVFYKWILWGVMSYWPSTDKSKLINLIEGTWWNEFIELNRMAFSELLPKNSESRAIAISIKLLKKNAPNLKWIISFADWCQCGDGTIYRASWFELTQISKNKGMIDLWNWEVVSQICITDGKSSLSKRKAFLWIQSKNEFLDREYPNWKVIDWFMLRYIMHLKPNLQRNYKIIDYKEIEKMWAKMYLGKKI
jgi:hypothetical protein